MKPFRVYQIDAFTRQRFSGNPAGVVANADGLTEDQMQALARELNNAETAFILSPDGPDHEVKIRFFTPKVEVPTCGHATVSAHYVRAMEQDLPPCRVMQKIGIGVLPVDIERDNDHIRITMTQGSPEVSPDLDRDITDEILGAMGLQTGDLDPACPVQIASTGHSKVMVGIRSRERLDGLEPDFFRLARLSRAIGSNGYFVFTLAAPDPGILTHGRMFAPAIGIQEDPVTGNANGPLGAYLVKNRIIPAPGGRAVFSGRQGEAMGRPGTVRVRVDADGNRPVCVRVTGDAVVAFKTEIQM